MPGSGEPLEMGPLSQVCAACPLSRVQPAVRVRLALESLQERRPGCLSGRRAIGAGVLHQCRNACPR